MTKINILSPDVIAKIAAGEAVDRPASVVKELLENAIDAGATSIEIHLKDAGKELIHIKDNGSGIGRDGLEKIFQRHATSKITAIEDLENLHSMGFRGEALYSISAVSDITLSTRTSQEEGWQIHIRGGVRQNLEPKALAQTGTDIKVAELFFNTPARRKFLKNNTSELNQILNIVLPYTLIYPDKSFVLTHAGRSLLDLRAAPSSLDRAAAVLNADMRHFLETDQEFVDEQIRIKLILGDINIQRPRRNLQFIFINNRPVESRNLSFNLNDVYKLILPPGVYGAFIVNITLNPSNVDVNIHPTKREVRLKDEARIISLLRRMTEYQLMHKGQTKEITDFSPPLGWGQETSFPLAGGVREGGLPADQVIFAPGQLQSHMLYPKDNKMSFPDNKTSFVEDANMRNFQLFGQENTLRAKFARAKFVGSFLQKYLLFEADESLLVVDQHAAQERIMFEKFRSQIEKSQVESQPLLTPVLLKLTPQEKIAWEENQEKLAAAGIETTQFDDDTIAVQTQPLLLKNIENVVRALLAGDEALRIDKDTLARRACKASVTSGDKLDGSQADYQRKQLLECLDPFTCPHGRPTVIEVNQTFLDRQFLRL
ncbi:MAG: DNA mismatch repair endonuclease MutL [Candidatus Omnitrophica bacterium]|nr:DNA mismatch repair endonuclease MutL [Candidatus Omnitrophota bacterium]